MVQAIIENPGEYQPVDIVLLAERALPCDGRPSIKDAAVAIRGGRIAAVGTRAALRDSIVTAKEQVNFGRALILPGLVNGHTHLEYTHAGPARPDGNRTFARWIEGLLTWSRQTTVEARLRSAYAGSEAVLRSGVTCVGEIVTAGQGLQAMARSGLHGVAFCEFIGGYTDGGRTNITARLDDLVERAETAAARIGHGTGIRIGVAPHAPYTVSEAALRSVTKLARTHGWPVACHLAESSSELEFLARGTGDIAEFMGRVLGLGRPLRPEVLRKSPADYVAAAGALALRGTAGAIWTTIIHGVHLSPGDIDRLATGKAGVVLCVRSNQMLNVGADAQIGRLARADLTLGIGTDSLASNSDLDLFAEMRALHAVWVRQEPTLAASQMAGRLLRMATLEGAATLGLAADMGSLTEGKRADLTVTDLPRAVSDANWPLAIIEQLDASRVIATLTDGYYRYTRPTTH